MEAEDGSCSCGSCGAAVDGVSCGWCEEEEWGVGLHGL